MTIAFYSLRIFRHNNRTYIKCHYVAPALRVYADKLVNL